MQKNNEIKWIFKLRKNVPLFLKKMKGENLHGFYRYSLSGDIYDETTSWGLANAVFFLKIIYTLNIEKKYKIEINEAIKFIKKFQKKDGSCCDPLITNITKLNRIKKTIKTFNIKKLSNTDVIRAETRQTISALQMFNKSLDYQFKYIPTNEKSINRYLRKLDWKKPWNAASHLSHLLFFLNYSKISNKANLINYSIDWINKIQRKDGFWYNGNPPIQQKINGAMKVFTGLRAVNKININNSKKIIDNILNTINNNNACDNFNIVYVLKNCNKINTSQYKYKEIKNFMINRLAIYKKYYYPKIGGFSFLPNKSNTYYYGAKITKGLNEPDIHGTSMFLYGIAMIAQTLKINDELNFKEFIP